MHYILIAIIAVVLIATVAIYNSLVSLRNKVNEAFATMDVYLKKRSDLIPNLVTVVKGYASHESETLQNTTAQRANASSRGEQLSAESNITSALSRIMVVAEKYPELKADQHFLELQSQLSAIEDDIASARRYYNGSVREMNNKVQMFPNNIFASIFHFKAMPMFEALAAERQNVVTNL